MTVTLAGIGRTRPSAAPIISAILPPAVIAAESFEHITEAVLYAEERVTVERAVAKRKHEFATGRVLARRALQQLGFLPGPIPSGPNREPQWPEGVVGSITHCAGYFAAAVGRTDVVAAVGIDAEPHLPLPKDVLRLITRKEERAWLRSRAGDPTHWDRLFFTAKESVFKAWFTMSRRWLDFQGATVQFEVDGSRFWAFLSSERAVVDNHLISQFEGRYLVDEKHVFAAVTVLRTGDNARPRFG